MKYLYTLVILVFACLIPKQANSQTLTTGEYFFDTDPGVDNGTSFNISSPGTDITQSLAIDITGLPAGFHSLNIRLKEAAGNWSLYENRTFYVQPALGNAVAEIIELEYFLDTDPGAGMGTPIDVVDGISIDKSLSIALTGLPSGFHSLNIRMKDSEGIWSLYENRTFYVQPDVGIAAVDIIELEYFLDSDPGVGAGTIVDLTDGTSIDESFDIALTGVPIGFHSLNVRVKDANGLWSLYENRTFYVQPVIASVLGAPLVAYEYFIGADPGVGNGTVVGVASTQQLDATLMVDLTGQGLTDGDYTLSIRVKDDNNVWSLFETRDFKVCTSAQMYYADSDGDGFGDLNNALSACTQPTGYVTNSNDCDDTDSGVTDSEVNWYADTDGDGFGDLNDVLLVCQAPTGYVSNSDDCDDTDVNINPDVVWYADTDGDGFGNLNSTTTACVQPTGFVANSDDCNDNDIDVNPTTVWYADIDADGFGDLNSTSTGCTQPTGFVANSDDCDDTNGSITIVQTWYADTDGDGFGDANSSQQSCTQPTGFVLDDTDCDDTDALSYLGETYYADSDGDGFGDANNVQSDCTQPTGYVANNTDCNDANAAINANANDVAGTGIDANCDGNYLWYVDVDGDSYGSTTTVSSTNATAGAGESATSDDCNDSDSAVNPSVIWFADADGDGFGDANSTATGCTQPTGFITDNTDCDDTNAAVNPATIWYADTDGDGHGDAANTTASCTQPTGFVANSEDCLDTDADVYPTAPALADGKDNDCDGTIDKVSQTITFEVLADVEDGSGDISLVASSSSQLPVGFGVTGPATIDGTTLSITGAGSVSVTATQEGNDGYLLADEVVQAFCVNPVPEAAFSFEGATAITLTSNYAEGNQWFMNEVSISGATNQQYDPEEGGLFHVEVLIDGCQGVSNTIDLILTAIQNETFDNSLDIYPMPVSTNLTIDTKNLPSGEYTIRMVDITGKYQMDKRISIQENSPKEINVNYLPQGAYTLILQYGEDVFIQKVIKK